MDAPAFLNRNPLPSPRTLSKPALMGPVIASIHDVRAKMRRDIMTKGELDREPRIRKVRAPGGETA